MTDEGITYEAFGDTTKLPAADADGQAITSEYYLDGQVYKQTQNEETSETKLDPEDRTLETINTGKSSSTITDHYDAPGSSIAWTSETNGKWERRIPGIEGSLAAIQTGTAKEDVTLQLHDLQGNMVATVEDSETTTKLLKTYNSTEYGTPNSKEAPPKYAYQGANGLTSENSTGRIVQDGITYVPQTGAMLQPPEDLAPGTPTNHNQAYVSNPNNPADEAGAHEIGAQIAKREQENREREEAKRPAGSVPSPEAEGEEGEAVLASWSFDHEGSGAHAADVITCAVAEGRGLPHESTHNPGQVNWVIRVLCTGIVFDLRIRLALFWEGESVSETGYVEFGNTNSAQETVQTPCIFSGWYTGWVSVYLVPPPNFRGRTSFNGWSKASRYVVCREK